jgi:peptidoglycan/xylan/chitin deacetylase (PgdA/CDA1 family)
MRSGSPVAVAAAGTAILGLTWAVRGRSSGVFGPSVWRGKPGRKAISITFDDGPTPATLSLLDILDRYRVRATFFQVGGNVAAFPDISREVVSRGHEIGNHSYTHPNFAFKSPAFVANEFTRAQQLIVETTGVQPRFLRAPYGVRWFGFRAVQRRLGLLGVTWSVIGLDWKHPADRIAERVITGARDGGIICLHDGRGNLKDPDVEPTLEAVRRILPDLVEKGYHFETVTQLLCPMK